MGSFWNCDRLLFEDLPTVRNLIWSADWEILAKEVAEYCERDESEGRIVEILRALEEMMGLEARKPSEKWVFLPYESYSEDPVWSAFNWGVDAALLRRRDFKVIADLSSREKLLYTARDCEKALERECRRLGNKYPDLYSWGFMPWDKVLSFRVWMHGGFCRKERYRLIACIVSELVRFGSTYEEARNEQRAIKILFQKKPGPTGDGSPRTTPAELLLRHYGLESSTDDYEREFEQRMKDAALVLSYNASVDLHRRVSDFIKREKRAEKNNAHGSV